MVPGFTPHEAKESEGRRGRSQSERDSGEEKASDLGGPLPGETPEADVASGGGLPDPLMARTLEVCFGEAERKSDRRERAATTRMFPLPSEVAEGDEVMRRGGKEEGDAADAEGDEDRMAEPIADDRGISIVCPST